MCTCLRVKAKDGSVVIGRTMEFGLDPGSSIAVFPRNYAFQALAPNDKPGLSWKGSYGFVGMSLLDRAMTADGINEKGLYVGLLYLPGFAKYQDIPPGEEAKSISQLDVPAYILSLCSSVEEVKNKLSNVLVSGIYVDKVKSVPGVHYAVHDSTGKSIVVEYVNGNLQVNDNPIGVMTNSPTFDWHLLNLRNYVNLSATSVPELKLEDGSLRQLGQGSGMLGLPGDSTPPSRFVRATALTQSLIQPENAEKAVNAAYHIINNFDIPVGFSRAKENGQEYYDFTFWTTISDLENKAYYYRGYDNLKVYRVDLGKIDFEGAEIKKLDTSNSTWFQEIS